MYLVVLIVIFLPYIYVNMVILLAPIIVTLEKQTQEIPTNE